MTSAYCLGRSGPRRAAALGAVALALAGCASGKTVEATLARMREVDAKVDTLQASQKAQAETVAAIHSSLKNQGEMAAGFAKLSDGVAVLGGRVEELNARTLLLGQKLDGIQAPPASAAEPAPGALEAELRAINLRLEKISERLRKIGAESPPGPGADADAPREAGVSAIPEVKKTAPAEREPGEIYQKAYSAYLAGQYAAAAAGFGAYLAKHPDAEFSSSAAYWLAETHAGKGDMPSALAAFDRMVESYPASVKAPAALLRGGEIAQKLGQKAEAGKRLRSIIGRYPDALEAKRAAAILKEIGQ